VGHSCSLIYPPKWQQKTHRQETEVASPPTRPPSTAPPYMSAEDESTQELLWDDELAAQFLESVSKQSSPSPSPPPTQSVSATGAATTTKSCANGYLESPLHCREDPLALEDWIPNEIQTDPDQESLPESARALMAARMAAPQGGLDGSYASHSCECPPSPKKRARLVTCSWVPRPSEQRFVGMISYC